MSLPSTVPDTAILLLTVKSSNVPEATSKALYATTSITSFTAAPVVSTTSEPFVAVKSELCNLMPFK